MEDATKPAVETPENQDELTAAMAAAAAAKAVLGSLEGLRSATESFDNARAEIGAIAQALNGLAPSLQQLAAALSGIQPETILERIRQQADENRKLILEALQQSENNRSEAVATLARQLDVLITETRQMQLPPPARKGESGSGGNGTSGPDRHEVNELLEQIRPHFDREEQDLKNIAAAISVIRSDLQQVASRKGILI